MRSSIRFWVLLIVSIPLIALQDPSESRRNAITRAIEEISPAVASINVLQIREYSQTPLFQDPFFQYFFPQEIYRRPMKSSGSGVVISPDGYILTNSHVIEHASEIIITLPGGKEYEAELIGSDKLTDLALLKLEGHDFPYARLGDSDELIIGEWVVALGNPFGLFSVSQQPTATAGIISAVHMDFGRQESGRIFQDMIQTDAAINPGNSGGPLINSVGEVIGINTFIFSGSGSSGSIGIGFAIPINRARKIAAELQTTGKVDRSFYTGLEVESLNRTLARYLEVPFTEGVIITEVEKGSPADRAGLEPADVIVSVEGTHVGSTKDIIDIIEKNDLRSGDGLSLRIYREGHYRTKSLRLGRYQ